MKLNIDIGNSTRVEFKGPDDLDKTMRSPEIDGEKYGKNAQEPSFLVERTNVAGSNPDQIIVNKLPEQESSSYEGPIISSEGKPSWKLPSPIIRKNRGGRQEKLVDSVGCASPKTKDPYVKEMSFK